MSMLQHFKNHAFGYLWCLVFVTAAACVAVAHRPASDPVPATLTSHSDSPIATSQSRLVAIEDVCLGDRVVVEASRQGLDDAVDGWTTRPKWDEVEFAIVESEWRALQLTMQGAHDEHFDISLLRPLTWIAESNATVDSDVHLHLPELGLDGPARVVSIEPCPSISSADGHVVTGTFTHIRDGIYDLSIAGQSAPIGVTNNHRIYSLDRNAYIPASELQVGERLALSEGDTTVTSLIPRTTAERVYNLEIHGVHVYHVTDDALLVHNEYESKKAYRTVSDAELEDIDANGFRPHPEGRSMEDKWFADTVDGARQHRQNYPDNNRIVEVEVPRDVYDRAHIDPDIDGFGGFAVPMEDQSAIGIVGNVPD